MIKAHHPTDRAERLRLKELYAKKKQQKSKVRRNPRAGAEDEEVKVSDQETHIL